MSIRLTLIGLGANTLLIGLFQVSEHPAIAFPVIVFGALLIGYGASPFAITGFRRLALYLPFSPKKSITTERDVTIAAKLRWDDAVGKPLVRVIASTYRVYAIWAALDIEIRNSSQSPQRISKLFMEIRSSRFPKRLIATADAVKDEQKDVKDRKVEWRLEPVSEAETHYVHFERFWLEGDETSPKGSKQFKAIIVAELGRPDRTVRLQIGDDIWDTTLDVTRLPSHTDEAVPETPPPTPDAR